MSRYRKNGSKIRVGLLFLFVVGLSAVAMDVPKATFAQESPHQYALPPGTVFRDPLRSGGLGPQMIVIPPGSFRMGDLQGLGYSIEKPVHHVTIARPLAFGQFEVTFGDYDRFCRETNRPFPPDGGQGRGRYPAIYVSWEDAVAYARWLSVQTGRTYRLASEAEWEYAARAGTQSSRYWGDEPEQACLHANVADRSAKEKFPGFAIHPCEDGYPFTAPVGMFAPNAFGLFDMLGNVWEWCQDTLNPDYQGAPSDGSVWEGWDENRVRRGGSWFSAPKLLRSAVRNGNPWGYRENDTGFRLVRELRPEEIARPNEMDAR